MRYEQTGLTRRRWLASAMLPVLQPRQAWGAEIDAPALISQFEKTLTENIVPFWYPRCLDREAGGYVLNFGPTGEALGPARKMIVTQARMVWFFAAVARAGYAGPGWGPRQLLEAAEHGYRFLLGRMRDPAHGGYFWEVDASGRKVTRPEKSVYGQAFVLYALAEYALATRRKDVLSEAVGLFELLERKAHDRVHGGYREAFQPDWTPLQGSGPMGPADLKLMNSHLHMLEAMTLFYQAGKLPQARERLLELMTIAGNTMVRKNVGACTDKYSLDWTPRLEGNYGRVSYGHDLEAVWLLMEACAVAGVPVSLYMDLCRTLWSYSLKYGFDEAHGGFYESGPIGQPADNRNKVWWVQAETLVSALRMYRATREPVYRAAFEKLWAFLRERQIDWEHGEWHDTILPDGRVRGNKAHTWKAAYHNGRE
jgi:mannobiose 2-epimerase